MFVGYLSWREECTYVEIYFKRNDPILLVCFLVHSVNMSATSANLISYRQLLFPLFLFQLSSAAQKISYTCLKHGEDPYIAVFAVITNEIVHDIFGKGAKDSCGLMAKNITGRGEEKWPYRFLVNLTGVGDIDQGVCGVVKKGDLVELSIVTRTSKGNFAGPTDKEAKIKCDFSKDHFVNTEMKVNLVEQKATENNVNISLHFEGSPTELSVGTETYLEMKLWSLTRFAVIVPFRCWAMRNSTDEKKVLLLDNYCPVTGAPIKLMFQFYKSYSKLRSNRFFAFRFFDSNLLLIRCLVDVCLYPNTCHTVNCKNKRKMRSVSEGRRSASADVSIIVVDENVSKFFNNSQLPFLGTVISISVLVVILIGTIITLAIKLNIREMSRSNVESWSVKRIKPMKTVSSIFILNLKNANLFTPKRK